jgi:SAM-dependent methyltransferase
MSGPNAWHNDDEFWELFEPILFSEERRSNARVEVDNLTALLEIQEDERILDLCCGTGRHSLELARQGFDVIGVDRTASFIEKARQNAEPRSLTAEFVVADMKEFCEPNRFDVVINLFGSFGYFEDPEDDRQVVTNMYASLRSGGRFLIETNGREITTREFQERSWSEHGDTLVLAERKPIENWRRIETRWIVLSGSQRVEHTVTVRLYDSSELSSLLIESGFSDVHVYGDLEGADYDHEAERLVVVGTK